MFELDKSILKWKRTFQQSCSLNDESIDELESHLRESVLEINRKGLSEEESFLVAMNRLGCAPTLAAEFKKNSPLGVNQDRLIWMLSGYLGVSICGIMSTAIVSSLATGMAYAGAGATATGIVATLVQILFWIAVFVSIWHARAVTRVFRGFPRLSLAAMLIAMITLPFVRPLADAARARVADQQWLVETYYWTGIGHFSIQLLVYAFCFLVLFQLHRSKTNLAVSQ